MTLSVGALVTVLFCCNASFKPPSVKVPPLADRSLMAVAMALLKGCRIETFRFVVEEKLIREKLQAVTRDSQVRPTGMTGQAWARVCVCVSVCVCTRM